MQMYVVKIKCNIPHKLKSSVFLRKWSYARILMESGFISLIVILILQIIIIIIITTTIIAQK
jgi:hypothetical protein